MAGARLFVHSISENTLSVFINLPKVELAELHERIANGSLCSSNLWLDTCVIRTGLRSEWGSYSGRESLFRLDVDVTEFINFLKQDLSCIQVKWETPTSNERKSARIGVKNPLLATFLQTFASDRFVDITNEWDEIKSTFENSSSSKYPCDSDISDQLSSPVKKSFDINIPDQDSTKEKTKKPKSKQSSQTVDNDKKKQRLTPSDKIFSRIQNDPTIESNRFIIGYTDRFTGVQEIDFTSFVTLENELMYNSGVPMHRIQYFKYNNELVWDRQTRLNLIDGDGFRKFDHDQNTQ